MLHHRQASPQTRSAPQWLENLCASTSVGQLRQCGNAAVGRSDSGRRRGAPYTTTVKKISESLIFFHPSPSFLALINSEL